MIKAIRAKNVYNLVKNTTAITNLATIFSLMPDEWATPTGSYIYISIVSDNTTRQSNVWHIMKKARISFHIVCKQTLWANETPESVLWAIIDAINNTIVSQWCTKVNNCDWLIVQSILEWTISPIFTIDSRYYQVKDYIFSYFCV